MCSSQRDASFDFHVVTQPKFTEGGFGFFDLLLGDAGLFGGFDFDC